jgi:hypothetical protein
MSQTTYAVIIVYSTSHALRAEKLLTQQGIACKLIPVPRHVSSDCGVCVRIARDDQAAALRALERAPVQLEGVHPI